MYYLPSKGLPRRISQNQPNEISSSGLNTNTWSSQNNQLTSNTLRKSDRPAWSIATVAIQPNAQNSITANFQLPGNNNFTNSALGQQTVQRFHQTSEKVFNLIVKSIRSTKSPKTTSHAIQCDMTN